MAGSGIPDFAKQVSPGDIIVAGSNFGCGSSREQAPLALKDAGVVLVVASSFARIFRRNAINIGLAVLQADLNGLVTDGAIITADVKTGSIRLPDGKMVAAQVPGENITEILAAGGLINKVRHQLMNKEA
jgi:3-isopropylmalate dehydratase small subunit